MLVTVPRPSKILHQLTGQGAQEGDLSCDTVPQATQKGALCGGGRNRRVGVGRWG